MPENNRPKRDLAQPTNDLAFKKMFANPDDTSILIDFLNAVLEPEYKMTVEEIKSFASVNLPNGVDEKLSAFDVSCVDKEGRIFIVEMQVLGSGWSKERAQWYVAQAYFNQVRKAKGYTEAKPVFLIAVLGFDMFLNHNRYISYFTTRDTVDNNERLDGFNFAFIELRKFEKQDVEKLSDKVALWCTFFKEYAKDDIIDKLCQKSAAIEKATNILQMYNWSQDERAVYSKLELISWDKVNVAEFAKKQTEEWIKNAEETIEAQAKKLKEAEDQVKQAKIAEEKTRLEAEQKLSEAKLEAEKQAKLEMAKKLLQTGMSAKEVALIASLTEKVLENL